MIKKKIRTLKERRIEREKIVKNLQYMQNNIGKLSPKDRTQLINTLDMWTKRYKYTGYTKSRKRQSRKLRM